MADKEKFDAVEVTNKLINDWLKETSGLPITLQLTKLGFKVIEGLEAAYTAGKAAGIDTVTAYSPDDEGFELAEFDNFDPDYEDDE